MGVLVGDRLARWEEYGWKNEVVGEEIQCAETTSRADLR